MVVETLKRLPIDPESIKYSEAHETVYALGRDDYAGIIFSFSMCWGRVLECAWNHAKEMSQNGIDKVVVGAGINEDESITQRRVVFENHNLGLWGNTLQNPELREWLSQNTRSHQ